MLPADLVMVLYRNVASCRAAELYGLEVVEHGIQDMKSNITRFSLLYMSWFLLSLNWACARHLSSLNLGNLDLGSSSKPYQSLLCRILTCSSADKDQVTASERQRQCARRYNNLFH